MLLGVCLPQPGLTPVTLAVTLPRVKCFWVCTCPVSGVRTCAVPGSGAAGALGRERFPTDLSGHELSLPPALLTDVELLGP